MKNILNFQNFEAYMKISVYTDDINHNNDYAIIKYRVYSPNLSFKEYSKKIPGYLIGRAIGEFEHQKGKKLDYGKEFEVLKQKVNTKPTQKDVNKKEDLVKKIIKITSIGVAISTIIVGGYKLIKTNEYKSSKTNKIITYENGNSMDELTTIYMSYPQSEKEVVEYSYKDYLKNMNNILSGDYSYSDIDNYLENVNSLINNKIFISLPGFDSFHFLPYFLDSNGEIKIDQVYTNKKAITNRNNYLQEQCRYLFYKENDKTHTIMVRNIDPRTSNEKKSIYYIPNNIEEIKDENKVILMKLTGLIEFKKFVVDSQYSYLDKNEKGIDKLYAGTNEIIENIDEKIDILISILKNRSKDIENSKKN